MTVIGAFLLTTMPGHAEKRAVEERPAYRNPDLPVEVRIDDLLKRMTLEEKVAQTLAVWPVEDRSLFDENGAFSERKAETVLKDGIGEIARLSWGFGPREGAELSNRAQKFLLERTRLGIPAIIHGEGLHGYQAKGATSFPQAIALASTWNPELVVEIFTAVAREMRARGVSQALTPVLDLGRDPRWGRTEETYGEDPYLVSRMGVACVRGFQGTGPVIDENHVAATVKHFAVYSQPERGINYSPGNYSERVIRENFFASFRAAITEAGAMSVMASYNEIDGIPSHANRWLLQRVLREEWDFKGFVVADYGGIEQLVTRHHVAHDGYEAARKALSAGVDIELPSPGCYKTLGEQIADGRIDESLLDRAVARVLRAKFLLGLFENPYTDTEMAEKITNSPEHRRLALDAARQAVVLLKNEGNLLPLDMKKVRSLAVIGPNAAGIHLGGYSWEPREGTGVLEGIRAKVGGRIDVRYALGCRITENEPLWFADESVLANPEKNRELIREAVRVAETSDVAVLVIGGNEATCREGWSTTHLGDRNSIELLGQQNDLVRAVVETGTPTVVILINGRPLAIIDVDCLVPSILECWYLGQETGTAVADILFGDSCPGGKLPITFPRSTGHIPAYYNHKPSINQDYLFESAEPLYPFGYGLSYTTFSYDNLSVSPSVIGQGGRTTVRVNVMNTGKVTGDEVVQLYIRDEVSSVTRPVEELKGFQRVTLKPGETKMVAFTVTPAELSFLNEAMERVVEPGEFSVMVGTNSRDLDTVKLVVEER